MSSSTASDTVPWRIVVNRQYGFLLAIICLGVCLHALNSLLVATMMPAIVADVGGRSLVAWTVSLYMLGTIVASCACASAAVYYGLRKPMLVVAILFSLGCLISAMASSMWVVLVGRLLQGLGGGGLLAFAYVSSAVLFPHAAQARVMGAVSLFWGASAFAGPLLGSVFLQVATWRVGFIVIAALSAGLAVAITCQVKDKHGKSAASAEATVSTSFPAVRLLCLSLAVIAIGLAGIVDSGWASYLMFVLGMVSIAVFLKLDSRRAQSRLLPARPIDPRHRNGAAMLMIFLLSVASTGFSLYGVLIITALHTVSVLVAGYIIAAPAIGWSLASVLVSGFPERSDTKFIGLGITMAALGTAGFAYSVPFAPLYLTVLLAVLEGAGFGIAWAFISRRMCKLADHGEVERTAGAIPTVKALGYAVGASFAGLVANTAGFDQANDADAIRQAAYAIFLAAVPLAMAGLYFGMVFLRANILQRRVAVA